MSYLPISGKDQYLDSCIVWGRMLYPSDEEKFHRFLSVTTTYFKSQVTDSSISLPPSVIEAVLFAPSIDNVLKQADTIRKRGLFVGNVLLNLMCQVYLGFSNASKNKAVFAVLEAYKECDDFSLTKIDDRKDWEHLKSVAHFWASYVLLGHNGITLQHIITEKLSNLLAVGEILRQAAETFQAKGASTTLLDQEKTWKVPNNYSLPGVNIDYPKDDEELNKVIDGYILQQD